MAEDNIIRLDGGELVVVRGSRGAAAAAGVDSAQIKASLLENGGNAIMVGEGDEALANYVIAVVDGEPQVVKRRR